MTFLAGRTDPGVIWDALCGYSGHLAFDVGANGGSVAAMLASHFARVVAFEPCRESFDHLAAVMPANVTCLPVAVSDHDGSVMLIEAEHAQAHGELVTGDSLSWSWGAQVGERSVACGRLDLYAATCGVPELVKIDTEGHEVQVVHGGLRLFAEYHPHLVIEVHGEANGEQIIEMLPDYRWETVRHDGYGRESVGWHNHYYLIGG